MSWHNVWLIFQREVRDQVRDRRTLFMVAILPLLLYPALGIGMLQMTITFSEQTRTVAFVGVDDLPLPPLLEGTKFRGDFFANDGEESKLRVLTDQLLALDLAASANSPGSSPDAGHNQPDEPLLSDPERAFLIQAIKNRDKIEALDTLVREHRYATAVGVPYPEEKNQLEKEYKQEIDDWFRGGPVQVLIVVRKGLKQRVEETNSQYAKGERPQGLGESGGLILLSNQADEKSRIAHRRVEGAVGLWEAQVLSQRFKSLNLPETLNKPIATNSIELARPDEISANLWSKLFPALLVIMSVTGAFYPAIDLGAGEKERGTMETLLICPASRTEIVVGKFLTVMGFSFTTALLNLTSMGFTGRHMLSAAGGSQLAKMSDLSFPPLGSLFWVILLAIPLAALFSALSLAFAMFARSSKEGQYYLTPLLMVTMGLTMFCLNPSVEMNPYYSMMPVVGPALLLKSLLLPSTPAGMLTAYSGAVLMSSCLYSGLSLWWAISLFQSENILFREAERLDIGLWFQHLFRKKEPTPSFSEAGFCLVVLMMAQFAWIGVRQDFDSGTDLEKHLRLLMMQMIYLIAAVGTPPLLMAILLTDSVRQTLKLRLPPWKLLVVGCILPFAIRPVLTEALTLVENFFPKPPAGMEIVSKAMRDPKISWWIPLVVMAVGPGICEELAFRGFILSGLQRSKGKWLPIVMSALAFGGVHLIPIQVFYASLLGIVLGLLAVRSGSLLPGIVFHIIFNALDVAQARIPDLKVLTQGVGVWFFHVVEGKTQSGQEVAQALRFEGPMLLICSLVCISLITWLIRYETPRTLVATTSESGPSEV